MNPMPPVVEVTDEKVARAVDVLKRLIDEGHPDSSHFRIALSALCTYMKIVSLLFQRGTGIKMLRHLLGIEPPLHEAPQSPKGGEKKGKTGKKNRDKHGRRGSGQFPDAQHRFFAHPTLLIKIVALLRKNAMSFMTLTGAEDSDRIMTVGATAGMAGVNLYDYFVCLQRYSEAVKENPERFLPWTYQETIRKIQEEELKSPRPSARELSASQWKERQEGIRIKRSEMSQVRRSRSPPSPVSARRA